MMETIQVSRRSFLKLVGFMPLAAKLLVTDSLASPLVEIQSEIELWPGANRFVSATKMLRGPASLYDLIISGEDQRTMWRVAVDDFTCLEGLVPARGTWRWVAAPLEEIIVRRLETARLTQTPDLDDLPWLTYSRPC